MPYLTFDPSTHPELTYDDVFIEPWNPLEEQVGNWRTEEAGMKYWEEFELGDRTTELEKCRNASRLTLSGPESSKDQERALQALCARERYVFSLAEKHRLGEHISRDAVDFRPRDGVGHVPIAIANMNAVTGKRMAEAAARVGATAVIPQDKSPAELEAIAAYLHSRTPYPTATTVTPQTSIREFRHSLTKRPIRTAVVVDDGGKFLGVLSEHDIPPGANEDTAISTYFRSRDVVTATEGITSVQAFELIEQSRVNILPILRQDGSIAGVLDRDHVAYRIRYPSNLDPEHGGLSMAVAVSAINREPVERVRHLIGLGVRVIVLDTAHFDQGIAAYRNLEAVRMLVTQSGKEITIVAGNVVTREALRRVLAAGADIVKVGIGPGAACKTRMETAVGRPQFTAVFECADEAALYGKHVWADGGIRHPRDLALALAAGASQAMWGNSFAPTYESPPPLEQDAGGSFKRYSGMASRQEAGLRDPSLPLDEEAIVRRVLGPRSEGVSDVKIYQQEGMRSIAEVVHRFIDGLTSAMTYVGARNLEEFTQNARIGIQSRAGYEEGKPMSGA